MRSKKPPSKLRLFLFEDKPPKIELQPGMAIQVVEVELVGTSDGDLKKLVARLGSGSIRCYGVIDISDTGPISE